MARGLRLKKSEVTLLALSGAAIVGYGGYRMLMPNAAHLSMGAGGVSMGGGVRLASSEGAAGGLSLEGLTGKSPAAAGPLPAARRDPFAPLVVPAVETVSPAGQPSSGGGGGAAAGPGPLPSAHPAPLERKPIPVPAVPTGSTPVPVPPAPEVPTILIGTALGQDTVALFQYGPDLVERRQGEHVGPFRVVEVDHGRVRLVNRFGRETWLLSGQTLAAGLSNLPRAGSPVSQPAVPPAGPAPSGPAPAEPAGSKPGGNPVARPGEGPVASAPAADPALPLATSPRSEVYFAARPASDMPLPLVRGVFPRD